MPVNIVYMSTNSCLCKISTSRGLLITRDSFVRKQWLHRCSYVSGVGRLCSSVNMFSSLSRTVVYPGSLKEEAQRGPNLLFTHPTM